MLFRPSSDQYQSRVFLIHGSDQYILCVFATSCSYRAKISSLCSTSVKFHQLIAPNFIRANITAPMHYSCRHGADCIKVYLRRTCLHQSKFSHLWPIRYRKFPQLPVLHNYPTWWPKNAPFLHALTLSNINRFSKLFHSQKQERICNNTITKDPTAPQVCRYTTLWNVKCLKSNHKKQDDVRS